MKRGVIMDEAFVYPEEKLLTVLKKSLFFSGDGFTAYDSGGAVVFRVDSYGPDGAGDTGEVVLMDAVGRCILTVSRKWASMHQRWEGFVGERTGQKPVTEVYCSNPQNLDLSQKLASPSRQKPLFSVRRSTMMGRAAMIVEVYGNSGEEYYIEGSSASRKCTIFNSTNEVMAEIRQKVDAYNNVMLGKDVFLLTVKPGFDGAFAMGLVLILDQIHWAEFDGDGSDGKHGARGVEAPPINDDGSKFSPR